MPVASCDDAYAHARHRQRSLNHQRDYRELEERQEIQILL
jgi:hypothetical protein